MSFILLFTFFFENIICLFIKISIIHLFILQQQVCMMKEFFFRLRTYIHLHSRLNFISIVKLFTNLLYKNMLCHFGIKVKTEIFILYFIINVKILYFEKFYIFFTYDVYIMVELKIDLPTQSNNLLLTFVNMRLLLVLCINLIYEL
jgi:hypothetical protein